jgi:hypothetical protein
VIFSLVVVLAAGALVWGATHDGSAKHGYGSVAQQTAARQALGTLQLPAGLSRDTTFTACGMPGDACLTSSADIAGTVKRLRDAVRTAGGSLATKCAPVAPAAELVITAGTPPPTFTCIVEGHLHGAWFGVVLGDRWSLPGSPAPRTAAQIAVETKDAPAEAHPALPTSRPDPMLVLPKGWTATPDPCGQQPSSSAGPSSSTGVVTPLDPCPLHRLTLRVSAPVSPLTGASSLTTNLLGLGFRLDGKPCMTVTPTHTCVVTGEIRSDGSADGRMQFVVATLKGDADGHMTGLLTLSDDGR